jgi:DNA-binding transcriptional regulator YiaG
LYRYYNEADLLLYVGISWNAFSRFHGHKRKAWFSDILKITIQQFPTRKALLLAEHAAIVDEAPRFNIQHSQLRPIRELSDEATQFRAMLKRLKLSQRGAARLFKVDERTARRWALGERNVPEPVAFKLNELVKVRDASE